MERQYLSAVGLVGYGTVILALYFVQVAGGVPTAVLRTGPFLLIAGALLYAGIWLVRHPLYRRHADRVLGWTLGVGVTFGAVATLVVMNHWLDVATDTATARTIFDTLTSGSLAGTVVGLYDAESRHRYAELEAEREHVERFARKAESLNRYAKVLNEASHEDEVSALSLEVVQLLIGSTDAAFFVVEDGTARVRDATAAYVEAYEDLAREVAARSPMTSVHCPSETSYDLPTDGPAESVVAVPIPTGPGRLAVLMAVLEGGESYDDEDVDLLELLASHMATALSGIDHGGVNVTAP